MIRLALLQTTAVQVAGDSLIVRLHSDPASNLQLWVPAAVTLVVLIVGGVLQWRVAKNQITTQRKIADDQLKMQRDLADDQLKTQREVAERQLEAQRELTERQIVASLRSKARLEWIEQLRRQVAAYITLASRQMHAQLQLGDLKAPTRPSASPTREELDQLSRELARQSEQLERVDKEMSRGYLLRANAMYQKLHLHLDASVDVEKKLLLALAAHRTVLIEEWVRRPLEDQKPWVEKLDDLNRRVIASTWAVTKEHYASASQGK